MVAIPVVLGSLLRIPLGVLTDRFGGRKIFTGMLLYCALPPLLVGFATATRCCSSPGCCWAWPAPRSRSACRSSPVVPAAAAGPGARALRHRHRRHGDLGLDDAGHQRQLEPGGGRDHLLGRAGRIRGGVVGGRAKCPDHRPRTTPYGRVLRSGWTLWQLALFYFVAFGGFVAMSLYLPKLLTDWFDYSQTSAGARAAGFVIVAALIARPLGGRWADRYGGQRVLSIAFFGVGLDAIGLSWQASDPSIVPVTIFCLSLAFFLGMGAGAVFKMVPTFFPETKGAVTGIVGAAGGLGGFFPPLVMGVVKDATGEYVMGFVLLVALAWLCAGQALAVREPHARPAGA